MLEEGGFFQEANPSRAVLWGHPAEYNAVLIC